MTKYLPSRYCRQILFSFFVLIATLTTARADDGYRLWLRYEPLPADKAATYRKLVSNVVAPGDSATQSAIRQELVQGCSGLLGQQITTAPAVKGSGAVVVGTPKSSPAIAALKLEKQLDGLGVDGYLIRSVKIGNQSATVI
ncbi:alpha-glucuronidase, partial [bacterium]